MGATAEELREMNGVVSPAAAPNSRSGAASGTARSWFGFGDRVHAFFSGGGGDDPSDEDDDGGDGGGGGDGEEEINTPEMRSFLDDMRNTISTKDMQEVNERLIASSVANGNMDSIRAYARDFKVYWVRDTPRHAHQRSLACHACFN
jgi:hypothetical protein